MADDAQALADHLKAALEARRQARPADAWPHLIAAESICRSTGRRRDLTGGSRNRDDALTHGRSFASRRIDGYEALRGSTGD